ncbi:DUF1385 domain-containing protein [Candidatus Woesearchaeota archaeon]|jgi:uncharacterized protein YqhQ|nr:DUF1385 domain-containing protein [Candidatus Woesearchaeota archaeon]
MAEKTYVGGQAVIEGVMMKNKNRVAVAVRNPKGKIEVKKLPYKPKWSKPKFAKLPIFRGFLNLVDTMVLGMKALNYSANASLEEDEKLTKKEIIGTSFFAILFAVGIFIVLPLYITKIFVDKGFLFNLVDGVFRILIFLIYILLISLMSDVKRVFQYHGAEHKTVNCYEFGKKLTIENVSKCSLAHRRCGTTFIIIVLVISILVFSLILWENTLVKILGRIILIPIIAGVSYELLRLGARYEKNILLNILIVPGLWIQKLTTREPDKKQLAVAIKSLQAVLDKPKKKSGNKTRKKVSFKSKIKKKK